MPTDDKQNICDLLLTTLQATREHHDLTELTYKMHDNHEETVTAIFNNKRKIDVNVSCDSGIAMIRDIIKGIN